MSSLPTSAWGDLYLPENVGETTPNHVRRAIKALKWLEGELDNHFPFMLGGIEALYGQYMKSMGLDVDNLETKYPKIRSSHNEDPFFISRSSRYDQNFKYLKDTVSFWDTDQEDGDYYHYYSFPLTVLDCSTTELTTCILIEHDFEVFKTLDPEFYQDDFMVRFRHLVAVLIGEEKFRNSKNSHG